MKRRRLLVFLLSIILGVSFYLMKIYTLGGNVLFSSRNFHPMIVLEIQNKKYLVEVDLGDPEKICLFKEILDQLETTKLQKVTRLLDFKGNFYTSPIFSVPKVKVLSHEETEQEIVQESSEFYLNTLLWSTKSRREKPQFQGRVGWPLFKSSVTLFDFPDFSISLHGTFEEAVRDQVLNMNDFVSIPFTIEKGNLFAFFETDLGKHKVILDTGASCSFLRKSKIDPDWLFTLSSNGGTYFKSSKLQIGGYNYGNWNFAAYELFDDIEGILGLDFFLQYAVLFDFENQLVYLEKPKSFFKIWRQKAKLYAYCFARKFINPTG